MAWAADIRAFLMEVGNPWENSWSKRRNSSFPFLFRNLWIKHGTGSPHRLLLIGNCSLQNPSLPVTVSDVSLGRGLHIPSRRDPSRTELG